MSKEGEETASEGFTVGIAGGAEITTPGVGRFDGVAGVDTVFKPNRGAWREALCIPQARYVSHSSHVG